MNLPKIILFFLFQIYYVFSKGQRKDYTDLGYESLLNWAIKNKLFLSDKIKLTKYNNEKQYISTNEISEGETIIDIPSEITLTINKSLLLLNSKNFEDKYNLYIKENKKSNEIFDDISHIDKSFLSYLLYMINKNKTNNKTNQFFEYYKNLFYIFEDDLSHLPSMFDNDQINSFINSSFGSVFILMNRYLLGEVNIFEKKIFNEKINLEEYLKFRFLTVQKSYNISNVTTVTPFIDLIKRDFKNVNCKIVVNKGHIKIKAIKNIKNKELLILKPHKTANEYNFFFYGRTYEELINFVPSFIIPIINPNFLIDEGINISLDENGDENKADLAWNEFFELVLPTYKQINQALKRDDSNYSCYALLLKYLNQIKEGYKIFDFNKIEEAFIDNRDSENVERIIKGEKKFLEKRINDLKDIMEKIKNKKKTKFIKRNKKDINEFVEDL